jgi:sigma-B regulation protein RsbU (phosphoserine phosphatase)
MHPRALAAVVAFSGLVAVAFALVAVRRRYWLFAPVVALQVLVPHWIEVVWPRGEAALQEDALRFRLAIDAVSLVPPAVLDAAWCEMRGWSFPAAEAGGDLVDALTVDGRPLGFVADVSGHGVPAGTLMGLLKASLRTRLLAPGDVGAVLADLNDVLVELTRPNTFATAAVLELQSPTRVAYVLAGHPPILHWRCARGSVARLGQGGMALGIRPGERYSVAHVDVAPGDVLAVLTDGFTETMDRADRELGPEPIEAALTAHGGAPLPEILDRLLGLARAHGPQQDDRTVLLVRVRAV